MELGADAATAFLRVPAQALLVQRRAFCHDDGQAGEVHARLLFSELAVGQRLGEALVIVAHDLEVDDEARLGVETILAAVAQEFLDTFSHGTLQRPQRRDPHQRDVG